MYLLHALWIEFYLYLCWWRYSMEYAKTHIMTYLLWIELFEALIIYTIWSYSWQCFLHIFQFWKLLKVKHFLFLPYICFVRVSNISEWYTGEVFWVRLGFSWIFEFVHPSICGAYSSFSFSYLACLNVLLENYSYFCNLMWTQWFWNFCNIMFVQNKICFIFNKS